MEPTKAEPLPRDEKAQYEAPRLRHLGDLREMTLGASGCEIDSGGTSLQRTIVCPP